MGGRGSGCRDGRAARACTDDYRSIDVNWAARVGLLRSGTDSQRLIWRRGRALVGEAIVAATAGRLVVSYRVVLDGMAEVRNRVDVRIMSSPTGFDGRRQWFACPYCERRVGVIYLGARVGCRSCMNLRYRSQREAPGDRAARRADAIRARMGWASGIFSPPGRRPLSMRWKTYWRLMCEYYALLSIAIQSMTV